MDLLRHDVRGFDGKNNIVREFKALGVASDRMHSAYAPMIIWLLFHTIKAGTGISLISSHVGSKSPNFSVYYQKYLFHQGKYGLQMHHEIRSNPKDTCGL